MYFMSENEYRNFKDSYITCTHILWLPVETLKAIFKYIFAMLSFVKRKISLLNARQFGIKDDLHQNDDHITS